MHPILASTIIACVHYCIRLRWVASIIINADYSFDFAAMLIPEPLQSQACHAEIDTEWKIQWSDAAPSSTQSVRCPGEGDTTGLGLAHRSCLVGGVWGSVDASECGSVAVREVSMQVSE